MRLFSSFFYTFFAFLALPLGASEGSSRQFANPLFSSEPVFMMISPNGCFRGLDGRNGSFIDFGINPLDRAQQFRPVLFMPISPVVVPMAGTGCCSLELDIPCHLVQMSRESSQYMLAICQPGGYASPVIDAAGRVLIFKRAMSGLFTPHIEKPVGASSHDQLYKGVAKRFAQINSVLYKKFDTTYQKVFAENKEGVAALFPDGINQAWGCLTHGFFADKVQQLAEPSCMLADEQKQNIAFFLQDWHTKVFSLFMNACGFGRPFVMPERLRNCAAGHADVACSPTESDTSEKSTISEDVLVLSNLSTPLCEVASPMSSAARSFAQVVASGLPQLALASSLGSSPKEGVLLHAQVIQVPTGDGKKFEQKPDTRSLKNSSAGGRRGGKRTKKNNKKVEIVDAEKEEHEVTSFSTAVITEYANRTIQLGSDILFTCEPDETVLTNIVESAGQEAGDHVQGARVVLCALKKQSMLSATVSAEDERKMQQEAWQISDKIAKQRYATLPYGKAKGYQAMQDHVKYISDLTRQVLGIVHEGAEANLTKDEIFESAAFQDRFYKLQEAFSKFNECRKIYETAEYLAKNRVIPREKISAVEVILPRLKFERWIAFMFGGQVCSWFDSVYDERIVAQAARQSFDQLSTIQSFVDLESFHNEVLDPLLHGLCHRPELHRIMQATLDIHDSCNISDIVLAHTALRLLDEKAHLQEDVLQEDCYDYVMLLHHNTLALCARKTPKEIVEEYERIDTLGVLKSALQRNAYSDLVVQQCTKDMITMSAYSYLLRYSPHLVSPKMLQDLYDVTKIIRVALNTGFKDWHADTSEEISQKKEAELIIRNFYVPACELFVRDSLLYDVEQEQWYLLGHHAYTHEPDIVVSLAYQKMRLYGFMQYFKALSFQEIAGSTACLSSMCNHLTNGIDFCLQNEAGAVITQEEKDQLEPLLFNYRDYIESSVAQENPHKDLMHEYFVKLFTACGIDWGIFI